MIKKSNFDKKFFYLISEIKIFLLLINISKSDKIINIMIELKIDLFKQSQLYK